MNWIHDAKAVRFHVLVVSFFVAALGARTAQSYWSLAEAAGIGAAPPGVQILRTYVPPVRKAVLVDPDGLAQRTADNTALTFRDRSRLVLVPRYRAGNEAAILVPPDARKDIVAGALQSAKPSSEARVAHAERVTVLARADEPQAPASTSAVEPLDFSGPQTTPEDFDALLVSRVQSAVLADDALYITGMNLQVTAENGVVTLVGPVNSENEKQRIGAIAKKIAGRRNVSNRLSVVVA